MKPKKVTKAMLYQDMLQEGYLLPKSTSTICNLAYLFKVRNGLEYCPMVEDVPNITCENPPKRVLLLLYIQEELEKIGDARSLTFDEKHLPDVDWCLKALSALDPLHQIFEPDYQPSFSHRGRRGKRYVPSAEDLLFQVQYPLNAKDDSQNEKNEGGSINCKSKYNTSKQEIKVKNLFIEEEEEEKVFDIQERGNLNDNKVGPLVQMLKKLEDRGLLQECMQHYIDIQNQYDKVNQQQQKIIESDLQSKGQHKYSKKNELKNGINSNLNAARASPNAICTTKEQVQNVPFQFQQEPNQFHSFKPKLRCNYEADSRIYFNWNNKRKQFTEVQSPSKQTLRDELKQITINKQNLNESSIQKTSASSNKYQYCQDPVMIKKNVRAFGTPESKRKELDVCMRKEDEEAMIDNNIGFQDAYDKENSAEREEHTQPQNFSEII